MPSLASLADKFALKVLPRSPRIRLESLPSPAPVALFVVLLLLLSQCKLSAPWTSLHLFHGSKLSDSYSPPQDRRKSKFGMKWPISISKPIVQDPEMVTKWEDRSSPVVPDIQRPATSLHPAYQGGAAYPPPPPVPGSASSRYSVVSNMTRF